MKKYATIAVITAIATFASCVSQSKYDKLNSTKSQLEVENNRLKQEIDDLRFGAPTLFAEGKVFFEIRDFSAAKEKFSLLVQKHPGKPETLEAFSYLDTIEEEIHWQSSLNSEDILLAEQYIEKYPRGKYFSKAKARLQELKELHMQRAYEQAVTQSTSYAWKNFIADYPSHPEISSIKDKIIRLEVDEIFSDSQTGRMPSFDRTSYSGSSSSSVSISNDTGCELVVRYSGSEAEMITIPIGGTKTVHLSSGSYRITASACGLNYAGTEVLSGSYNSTFYISNSRW